jgi:hypothetical protein
MQSTYLPSRRRDILLLVFSIVGIFILIGRGIYLYLTEVNSFTPASSGEQTSTIFGVLGLFLCATLLLPLMIVCIKRLKGQEIITVKLPSMKIWQMAMTLLIWASMIGLGVLLANSFSFGWLISLPFFLLGIGTPVAGIAWTAIGGIPTGSMKRLWAAFGIGMIGSTLGAMIFEYALVGIAALALGIIVTINPEWQIAFQQIRSHITNGGDIQNLLITLAPYLTNPLVLLLALLFAALIVPLIEETLKPMAVWLIGKKLKSPAEGFALGALCGAGFALLEGTLAASGSGQMLGVGIAARATSSLMHITASGILGWGIASARLEKRLGRLVGAYTLSVFIHGMWNGSVVLLVFGALRLSLPGAIPDVFSILLSFTGIGILGSMLISIAILLPILNRQFTKKQPATRMPLQSDIIPPLNP